jgi:DnaJ-domain-containing protein 1
MDIQLFSQLPSNLPVLIEQDIALRSYYLDWDNFETSSESIEAMLEGFWQRYNTYWGAREATLATKLDTKSALQVFELTPQATRQDIRRRWRKLALKWHPDRSSGDAVMFRQVCMAWQTLR